ncbi:endonuclease domain-containing protein [Leptolyngbya sp. BC1307]|uniref:endonuclease domain-containing protein n=1 Tax=Leptolyngbya sp. BC1307 TaxID=2029589 RepID=UPI000EFB8941|nr:endonuclease domain-containing protein [Leptolyngbya sp. BC1307]
MTKIYNRQSDKDKRQMLRNSAPNAEILLWQRIRRQQIGDTKFRRQYGVERFVLDFYCPQLKLAIEVDGPTHAGTEPEENDRIRQSFIESLGVQFLRFTNVEIYQNLDGVIQIIHEKVISLKEK